MRIWRLAWWRGTLRAVWLELQHFNDPLDRDTPIDVTRPAVKRMIARARLERMREAGAMVCWSYFRDRVAERRELRTESDFEKRKRLIRARLDKINAKKAAMRLVV